MGMKNLSKIKKNKKSEPHWEAVGEVIGLAISLAVLFWLLPRLSFITDSYQLWLPIAVTTTIIDSTISFIKHLSPKPWKYGLEALSHPPAMYSIWKLIEIFPLDFAAVNAGWLNTWFMAGLWFCLAALGIAVVVNGVKFVAAVMKFSMPPVPQPEKTA